jgi:large subunit ribosomal protein L25
MTKQKKQVLEVEKRENCGSSASRRDRKAGKVPAVVYGHGADPKHILVDEKAWMIVSKQDVQIVELKQSGGESLNVLIKDVQHDFLTGAPKHIDFLEVKMDEVITTSVPVHGIGTPVGLSQGGILEQQVHELEISCTPLTMPESIECDISGIEVGGALHVSDLTLPEGVTAVTDGDQTLFQVAMPKAEEEPAGEEGVEGEEGVDGETEASDAATEDNAKDDAE